jgi:thiol-disulfide isomerase/thioredoxin
MNVFYPILSNLKNLQGSLFLVGFFCMLQSCNVGQTYELRVYQAGGFMTTEQVVLDSFLNQSVVVAYDPECPICLLYKTSIDYLSKTYENQQIYIILTAESDTSLIKDKFYADSRIRIFQDPSNKLLRKIGATTTPHAFVYDAKSTLVYSGKIDNRAKALGIKTDNPDSLYVSDALKALSKGQLPYIKKTQPIGCLIQ